MDIAPVCCDLLILIKSRVNKVILSLVSTSQEGEHFLYGLDRYTPNGWLFICFGHK